MLDYHQAKVLSVLIDGERWITPSTSWLAASVEMAELTAPKVKKAYKEFVPTPSRMTNMIRGERRTINMPTVLYPGRDTVVRVGRHNARIDEGYNEVIALNGEAVMAKFGGWIAVMDSVANGEAFIIVRNLTKHAISLASGELDIAIRPAVVCLPRILSATDVQKLRWRNLSQTQALSSKRYGGQALLVKKSLHSPTVSYNMGEKPGHYGSGRFV